MDFLFFFCAGVVTHLVAKGPRKERKDKKIYRRFSLFFFLREPSEAATKALFTLSSSSQVSLSSLSRLSLEMILELLHDFFVLFFLFFFL